MKAVGTFAKLGFAVLGCFLVGCSGTPIKLGSANQFIGQGEIDASRDGVLKHRRVVSNCSCSYPLTSTIDRSGRISRFLLKLAATM